jgi:lipoprotein-anchoring transpeptidase ErfK/SrfK
MIYTAAGRSACEYYKRPDFPGLGFSANAPERMRFIGLPVEDFSSGCHTISATECGHRFIDGRVAASASRFRGGIVCFAKRTNRRHDEDSLMQAFRNSLRLSSFGVILLFGGCAMMPPFARRPAPAAVPAPAAPAPAVPAPPRNLVLKKGSYWKGEGVSGAPSIVISLGDQRAYFYRGGKLVGVSAISSGRKGFDTPIGDFHVIQRDKDHASNLYGDYVSAGGEVLKHNADTSKDHAPPDSTFQGAKMPFFIRFHEGAGMHAGHLPGHRASHGCVRLPRFMAEHFFKNVELGTPVKVTK